MTAVQRGGWKMFAASRIGCAECRSIVNVCAARKVIGEDVFKKPHSWLCKDGATGTAGRDVGAREQ
jgi:hypothetical protein